MVGQMAVLPHLQSQGDGAALMLASLSAMNPQAPLQQVMIGNPEYYEPSASPTRARPAGACPGLTSPAALWLFSRQAIETRHTD
jgi:predicted N-acetyltransferase YhbS